MKKSILTSAFVCAFTLLSNAQFYPYHSHFPSIHIQGNESVYFSSFGKFQSSESKLTLDNRKKLKLTKTVASQKNNKGKIIGSTTCEFNESGRLISYETNKSKTVLTYLNDSILTEINVLTKHPEKYTITYENKQLVNSKKLVDNKVVSELKMTYNLNGKITSIRYEFGRKLKKSEETKTFYNAQGKVEKTQTFVNDELKKEYIYDCKDEGAEIKKTPIETSTICKWTEERNDSSYTIYSRTIEKEREILWKTNFSKDSIFISQFQYLNDTLLFSKNIKFENTFYFAYYKKNGELNNSSIDIYSKTNKLLESQHIFYGSHPFISIESNEYDEKESLLKTIKTSNRKVKSTVEYNHIYRP